MKRYVAPIIASILFIPIVAKTAGDGTALKQVAEADKPYLLIYPDLEDSMGEVVLTNEYVVLQRLVVPAGAWEGIHSHPGNQVYIQITAGFWSERYADRQSATSQFRDAGSAGWLEAIDISTMHDAGNTGDAPIDLVLVTLK